MALRTNGKSCAVLDQSAMIDRALPVPVALGLAWRFGRRLASRHLCKERGLNECKAFRRGLALAQRSIESERTSPVGGRAADPNSLATRCRSCVSLYQR